MPEKSPKQKSFKQKLFDAIDPSKISKNHKHKKTLTSNPLAQQCALLSNSLSNKCYQCNNKGYYLYQNDAYIGAKVCSCVMNCPLCHGSSLYLDSKTNNSKPCVKLLPHIIAANYNYSSIAVKYIDAHLNKFANYSGNADQILTIVKKFIDDFKVLKAMDKLTSDHDHNDQDYKNDKHNHGLIISGDIGIGKTYILVSIAKALIEKGYKVKLIDFFQLISQIKSGFNKNTSEEELIEPLIDVDILLIDELGKGRNSEFELTILDQIVMRRYNYNKSIIATTNYSLNNDHCQHKTIKIDQIYQSNNFNNDYFELLKDRLGNRIFSRLNENCRFVTLTGKDFREMIQQQKTQSKTFDL